MRGLLNFAQSLEAHARLSPTKIGASDLDREMSFALWNARAVGVHEVHYAMVVVLAMGIGLFAPPFGVGYYAACAIGKVDPAEGIRPIWGYLLALMVGLVIVAMFPWISIGFL